MAAGAEARRACLGAGALALVLGWCPLAARQLSSGLARLLPPPATLRCSPPQAAAALSAGEEEAVVVVAAAETVVTSDVTVVAVGAVAVAGGEMERQRKEELAWGPGEPLVELAAAAMERGGTCKRGGPEVSCQPVVRVTQA